MTEELKEKKFENKEKFIIFRLQNQYFGTKITDIKSIEKVTNITRVPGIPDYIVGVINLRGIITPVIDLKKRFNMGESEFTEQTRIIVIDTGSFVIGLIVDNCNEVADLSIERIEPAPEVVGEDDHVMDYLSGVITYEKRLINLINIEKTLDKNGVAESILSFHKKF